MTWLLFVHPRACEMWAQRTLITVSADLAVAKVEAEALVNQQFYGWQEFYLVALHAVNHAEPQVGVRWS